MKNKSLFETTHCVLLDEIKTLENALKWFEAMGYSENHALVQNSLRALDETRQLAVDIEAAVCFHNEVAAVAVGRG